MVSNRSSSTLDLKARLREALARFGVLSPSQAAREFWEVLGYGTDLSLQLTVPEDLLDALASRAPRRERLLIQDWRSLDGVFQLGQGQIWGQRDLFQTFDWHYLRSYILIAVSLSGSSYGRSELAQFTRELNRLSDIPVLVLFRYGNFLTLAVIHRRPNLRDQSRDVLEKISLIKDINIHQPHRAHLEILAEFAAPSLMANYGVRNFDDLHGAWLKVLDISVLNRRFFGELSAWYFWAAETVFFPGAGGEEGQSHQQMSVIRLITRLIFVWFLQEKHIIDPELFQRRSAELLLKDFDPNSQGSEYYRAVLQNLFFATLNTERSAEKIGNRQFAPQDSLGSHDDPQFFQYRDYFQDPDHWLMLVKEIPFLNGGLFECLDQGERRVDGFWDHEANPLRVPNYLFFGQERLIDLSAATGNKQLRNQKVRGLFEIFQAYKFTIDENTPLEEEVALDPELLGKVFENLLAEYNPETGTTARKKTGSFYTPREIVDYMVDEALIAYLMSRLWRGQTQGVVKLGSAQTQLFGDEYTKGQLSLHQSVQSSVYPGHEADLERDLRALLAYDEANPFIDSPELRAEITQAVAGVQVLDPACGSGAFPMGILQKLVHILNQVDPDNALWLTEQKNAEIAPVLADIEQAKKISYEAAREEAMVKLQERLGEIEAKFGRESQDYPRKLFLIERCIFGVDIQPIAVQIAKLRFFIALIVEQGITENEPNRGIVPLPNLETKFVAANTLVGIPRQQSLRSAEVFGKEKMLREVRQRHFLAQTPGVKAECRAADGRLRSEIGALLRGTGLSSALVDTLASWNPYDQNASASFFDPEWMFGVTEEFDIVIGNPPYVRIQSIDKKLSEIYKNNYKTAFKNYDVYVLFIENAISKLTKKDGCICFINPTKFIKSNYGDKLKEMIYKNKLLSLFLDLTDVSVFDSVIAYTGVFIFSKQSKNSFKYFKVEAEQQNCVNNLAKINFNEIPYQKIANKNWILGSNELEAVFQKFKHFQSLNEIANIFVGLQTSADPVYILEVKNEKLYSKYTNKEYSFDYDIVKPLLKGAEIKRYSTPIAKYKIIFPYYVTNGNTVQLLSENVLSTEYPLIWKYFLECQEKLTGRENGKMNITEWWAFGRNQNLNCFAQTKIITQVLANHSSLTLDLNQEYYFVGGGTAGGYGIVLKPDTKISYQFLLGLLNSSLLEKYLQSYASPFKGGFFAYNRETMGKLPIPSAGEEQKQAIESLVEKCLGAEGKNCEQWEKEINQIVYQLYGLTPAEISLIEGEK